MPPDINWFGSSLSSVDQSTRSQWRVGSRVMGSDFNAPPLPSSRLDLPESARNSFIPKRCLLLALLAAVTLAPLHARAPEEPAQQTLFLPKSPTAAAYRPGRSS